MGAGSPAMFGPSQQLHWAEAEVFVFVVGRHGDDRQRVALSINDVDFGVVVCGLRQDDGNVAVPLGESDVALLFGHWFLISPLRGEASLVLGKKKRLKLICRRRNEKPCGAKKDFSSDPKRAKLPLAA